MCPGGPSGPQAVTVTELLKYQKKGILLRCLHHFSFDLNNNMDQMWFSDTEPHQKSLAKQNNFEKWKVIAKSIKTSLSRKTHKITTWIDFKHIYFRSSQNDTNQSSRP